MSDLLSSIYFHGTRHAELSELDPTHSDASHPFGKAVYLSRDKSVARRYVRDQGNVYQVQLKGNPALTINLDAAFIHQSIQAREIIRKIIILPAQAQRDPRITARELIDDHDLGDHSRMTARLLDAGIWLIYGTLAPDESSGAIDAGVQYAVLHREHLAITGVAPQP